MPKRQRQRDWQDVCSELGNTPLQEGDLWLLKQAALTQGFPISSPPTTLCEQLYRASGSPPPGRRLASTQRQEEGEEAEALGIEILPPEILEYALSFTGLRPEPAASLVSSQWYEGQRGAYFQNCRVGLRNFEDCGRATVIGKGGSGLLPCGRLCAPLCEKWMQNSLEAIERRHPFLGVQLKVPEQEFAGLKLKSFTLPQTLWMGRLGGVVQVFPQHVEDERADYKNDFKNPVLFYVQDERKDYIPRDLAFIWPNSDTPKTFYRAGEFGETIISEPTAENVCAFVSDPASHYTGIYFSFYAKVKSPSGNQPMNGIVLRDFLSRLSGPLEEIQTPASTATSYSDPRIPVSISPLAPLVVDHTLMLRLNERGDENLFRDNTGMKAYTINRGSGKWRVRWYGAGQKDEVEIDVSHPPSLEELAVLLAKFPSPQGGEVEGFLPGTQDTVVGGTPHVNIAGNGAQWNYLGV